MKNIKNFVILICIFIIVCGLGGCQNTGKKKVRLTSDNYEDFLNIKIVKASMQLKVEVESKNKDYIFEDATATIYYAYDVEVEVEETYFRDNEWGGYEWSNGTYKWEIAKYTDGTYGSNQSGHIEIVLNRDGNYYEEFGLEIKPIEQKWQSRKINNLKITNIEFKSGTVRKNELEN